MGAALAEMLASFWGAGTGAGSRFGQSRMAQQDCGRTKSARRRKVVLHVQNSVDPSSRPWYSPASLMIERLGHLRPPAWYRSHRTWGSRPSS